MLNPHIQNKSTEEHALYLYNYVLQNNPLLNNEHVKEIRVLNKYDLLIIFQNNVHKIYDTFDGTVRPYNNTNRKKTDTQLKKDFMRSLQILMNRKHINQEDLAKRLNISQPMVSKYLNGTSIPSIIMLKRISDVLECRVDDFYEEYYM